MYGPLPPHPTFYTGFGYWTQIFMHVQAAPYWPPQPSNPFVYVSNPKHLISNITLIQIPLCFSMWLNILILTISWGMTFSQKQDLLPLKLQSCLGFFKANAMQTLETNTKASAKANQIEYWGPCTTELHHCKTTAILQATHLLTLQLQTLALCLSHWLPIPNGCVNFSSSPCPTVTKWAKPAMLWGCQLVNLSIGRRLCQTAPSCRSPGKVTLGLSPHLN